MSLAHATRDNPTAAAHRIGSDDEALETARELAALFARAGIARDRERRLPREELERFSRSGLWGITVPREYGGAGVSRVTLARVVAIISAADGSLGQIPQNHFYALEVLRVNGNDDAESPPVRRGAGRRALRQRAGGDRHPYRP